MYTPRRQTGRQSASTREGVKQDEHQRSESSTDWMQRAYPQQRSAEAVLLPGPDGGARLARLPRLGVPEVRPCCGWSHHQRDAQQAVRTGDLRRVTAPGSGPKASRSSVVHEPVSWNERMEFPMGIRSQPSREGMAAIVIGTTQERGCWRRKNSKRTADTPL